MGTIRKVYRGSKNALIISIPIYLQEVTGIQAGDLIDIEINKVYKKEDQKNIKNHQNIVQDIVRTNRKVRPEKAEKKK